VQPPIGIINPLHRRQRLEQATTVTATEQTAVANHQAASVRLSTYQASSALFERNGCLGQ
jgi:hypothetical protein